MDKLFYCDLSGDIGRIDSLKFQHWYVPMPNRIALIGLQTLQVGHGIGLEMYH